MHARALDGFQVADGVCQFLLQRDAQGGLLHRLRHAEGGLFEACVAGRARLGQAFGRQFQSRFLGARFSGTSMTLPPPEVRTGIFFSRRACTTAAESAGDSPVYSVV
jgi:hypothetical protein